MNDYRPRSWHKMPRAGKIFWIVVITLVTVILLSFAIWPDGSFPVPVWPW